MLTDGGEWITVRSWTLLYFAGDGMLASVSGAVASFIVMRVAPAELNTYRPHFGHHA